MLKTIRAAVYRKKRLLEDIDGLREEVKYLKGRLKEEQEESAFYHREVIRLDDSLTSAGLEKQQLWKQLHACWANCPRSMLCSLFGAPVE